MTDWNNLRADKRIAAWRQHRLSLKTLPINQALLEIANFFADMPLGPRTIDFYNPNTWPDPWDILADIKFCENSISLMMYYTVISVFPDANIKMYVIDDTEQRFMVPVVDGIVLNYYPRDVIELNNLTNITVIDIYSKEHIRELN